MELDQQHHNTTFFKFGRNILATLTTYGEILNCVQAIWNNILAPGLESFIEMVKNVVIFQANFVFETVWNVIVESILPNCYNLLLPSDQQTILNQILDPSVWSSWFTNIQTVLGIQSDGLLSQTLNVLLITFPSLLGFLGQLFATIFQLAAYLGQTNFHNSSISTLSWFSFVLFSFLALLFNYYKTFNNSAPTADEKLVFLSSIGGELLKYDVLLSIAGKIGSGLDPRVVGLLTGISWGSDMVQFLAQANTLI